MSETRTGAPKRFIIDDRSNYISITRADLRDRAYRISAFPGVGSCSGMLVLFEALRGAERVAAITVQWDKRGRAFRAEFQSGQSSASIEVNDLSAALPVVIVKAGGDSTTFLVDRRRKEVVFPPDSTGPTYPIPCPIVEALGHFNEIEPAVQNIVASQGQTTHQEKNGVIFDTKSGGGSGSSGNCDRDRKTGWIQAAGEFLAGAGGAIAGALSGGIAIGVLLAIGAGLKSGADAGDTENKYDDCEQQAGSGSPD
jgi:hypothetical protein